MTWTQEAWIILRIESWARTRPEVCSVFWGNYVFEDTKTLTWKEPCSFKTTLGWPGVKKQSLLQALKEAHTPVPTPGAEQGARQLLPAGRPGSPPGASYSTMAGVLSPAGHRGCKSVTGRSLSSCPFPKGSFYGGWHDPALSPCAECVFGGMEVGLFDFSSCLLAAPDHKEPHPNLREKTMHQRRLWSVGLCRSQTALSMEGDGRVCSMVQEGGCQWAFGAKRSRWQRPIVLTKSCSPPSRGQSTCSFQPPRQQGGACHDFWPVGCWGGPMRGPLESVSPSDGWMSRSSWEVTEDSCSPSADPQ